VKNYLTAKNAEIAENGIPVFVIFAFFAVELLGGAL
jgi:hypothetical protein